MKEMNSLCIDTFKVPVHFGTGDNVETFTSNILNIKKGSEYDQEIP